jgi:hypothetical protein
LSNRETRLKALEQRIGAPDSNYELFRQWLTGSEVDAAYAADRLAERGIRTYPEDRRL